MKKIYDLLIIGGGPAGLSAGVYAGRAKLKTIILEKGTGGGQAATTSEIANYPGIRHISGPRLVEEMKLQNEDFGVEFAKADVTGVDFSGEVKVVKTLGGDYHARAVIIATGATPRTLGFPGEEEFTGRGVAYCSTCDGEFFEGLEVFVIGAGYAAAEEAIFLTRFATKVTIIARESSFSCAPSIVDKVMANDKIEVKFNTEILGVYGDGMIQSARFINNATKEEFEYKAKEEDNTFGVFVFIGYEPKTEIFKGHIEMDHAGYILTDDDMKTNVNGVYAAGDLRPKSLRQIITAVSDGAIAATDAGKYIEEEKDRLGIKDEPEVEKPAKKEQAAVPAGKSALLSDALRGQLKGIFGKMESDVTLVSIVDESLPKSVELRDFLLDVAELGDRLHLELYNKGENTEIEEKINADKFPVVSLLNSNGEYSGVKYHGVPGGHELNSFILAIYNLAGPGQALDSVVLNSIKGISKKANIKVMVSLACHYCPDVVVGAQRIAIENPNVEAEMVDISNFQEIKKKYKVMSVPAMIINDEEVVFGAKKIDEIAALLV
ncbi:FAD-dependent oxidoreductase [Peribacillus simplex]|uniref:FAD-dependent oxidoreductase n=2 Tax=Peribacillus TaxID=2675229 RepID=A0AA90P8K8_9BACI|nr:MULTISPECIES: FAD-dependent oxidoreductase [Peribacillus]MDP1418834.1 FAD-dependent oxidoreductase [Peribacillus simplex]MDP1450888.1 FAD-dependent oxidoreductase [Peribacillus frigoritolerans]